MLYSQDVLKYIAALFSDDSHLCVLWVSCRTSKSLYLVPYQIFFFNVCTSISWSFWSPTCKYVQSKVQTCEEIMLRNLVDRSNPCRLTRDTLIDWKDHVVGRILKNLVTRAHMQKMEIKLNKRVSQFLKRQSLTWTFLSQDIRQDVEYILHTRIAQFTLMTCGYPV